MQLLRDCCGVNAIRLRVWVDPAEGWCGVDDVVVRPFYPSALDRRSCHHRVYMAYSWDCAR